MSRRSKPGVPIFGALLTVPAQSTVTLIRSRLFGYWLKWIAMVGRLSWFLGV